MNDIVLAQSASGRPATRTRRLSVWRLLLAVVLVSVLTGGGYFGWQFYDANRPVAAFTPWFAGYVDATATPTYAYESPATKAGNNVMLSFIVASTQDSCEPSWGTYYSLDSAATDLDMDRRVARLVQQGGQVSVSFGGAINDELSTVCTDSSKLVAAYAQVIDRYKLTTIDLDIEADDLSDTSAGVRRAKAISTLQEQRAAAKKPVNVWLTLPVSPTGLTEEGLTAVKQMLQAGVDLAGVNAMTMDYGQSRSAEESMADASISALTSTHEQLVNVYRAEDISLTAAELWTRMGATPMIGQNDVRGEIFSLADARSLNAFARSTQLGRMSMWSLNRDSTCGDNYVDLAVVSDACSGVDQKDSSFADVLANKFNGHSGTRAVASNEPSDGETMVPAPAIIDDPVTSPYVVWDELTVFQKGNKVVWHAQVYEAKWWSTGDFPDDPAVKSFDTPWTLIGPVLESDVPRVQIVLPVGSFAEWSPTSIYLVGDRVMVGEVPYEAKWWTQGDSPEASTVSEVPGPWRLLTGDEVTAHGAAQAAPGT